MYHPLIDHNYPSVLKHGLLDNSPRFSSMIFRAINLPCYFGEFPAINPYSCWCNIQLLTTESMSNHPFITNFLWLQSPSSIIVCGETTWNWCFNPHKSPCQFSSIPLKSLAVSGVVRRCPAQLLRGQVLRLERLDGSEAQEP